MPLWTIAWENKGDLMPLSELIGCFGAIASRCICLVGTVDEMEEREEEGSTRSSLGLNEEVERCFKMFALSSLTLLTSTPFESAEKSDVVERILS